jgi:pimeloyl-ACP methyl ester carboxylesterase
MVRRQGRIGRGLVLGLAAALALTGCVLTPNVPGRTPGEAASAPASDLPATPSDAPVPDGRPLQPIPDIAPTGFTDPPRGDGLARYTGQRLRWQDCEEGQQCATVLVPLDYAAPDEQAITLTLRRRQATKRPRLGSLFINPGGPGGSGVDYVGFFTTKGLEQYDVVGWDPRGVGRSTPVQCVNGTPLDDYFARDGSPDDPGETTALIEAERAFGRSCLERSGPLLSHVSTEDTARDLELLRGLVGDKRLSYFGSSYGTSIGSLYAELYPQTVGRMVLDGAVDITGEEKVSQTEGFERALRNFARWCAQQHCRLGSTQQEVQAAVAGLWQRLDDQPIDGGRRPLNQQLAVDGVARILYDNEESWKYLRQALESAVFDDDGRFLLYLADLLHERTDTGEFGQSNFSFPAVRCLDSQDVSVSKAQEEARRDAQKAPVFGQSSGPDLVCPMWPVAPAPKAPRIDAAGAAPILVVGTTGDPATPYENAQTMAAQLESGVLITLRGEGHLAYDQSRCVQQKVVAYLVKGRVPADGSRC